MAEELTKTKVLLIREVLLRNVRGRKPKISFDKIGKYLQQHPDQFITTWNFRDEFNVSFPTAKKRLEMMKKENLIKGTEAKGVWYIPKTSC